MKPFKHKPWLVSHHLVVTVENERLWILFELVDCRHIDIFYFDWFTHCKKNIVIRWIRDENYDWPQTYEEYATRWLIKTYFQFIKTITETINWRTPSAAASSSISRRICLCLHPTSVCNVRQIFNKHTQSTVWVNEYLLAQLRNKNHMLNRMWKITHKKFIRKCRFGWLSMLSGWVKTFLTLKIAGEAWVQNDERDSLAIFSHNIL